MRISIIFLLLASISLNSAKSQSISSFEVVDGNALSMMYDKFIGTKFPLDKLKDLKGNFTDIRKYKGKPILINFWFTTCPPCIGEMPDLNRLKAKYDKEIHCIAITHHDKQKVVKFLKTKKFNFDQYVSAQELLTKFDINGFPMSFLVDKSGIIRFAGFVPSNDIDGFLSPKIRQLL